MATQEQELIIYCIYTTSFPGLSSCAPGKEEDRRINKVSLGFLL